MLGNSREHLRIWHPGLFHILDNKKIDKHVEIISPVGNDFSEIWGREAAKAESWDKQIAHHSCQYFLPADALSA